MDLFILDKKRINLLKKLKFLSKYGFYLAGGTALALQIGHRTSMDFDFYTEKKFSLLKLQRLLEKKFKEAIVLQKAEGTLIMKIDGVANSFFQYPYPLIFPPIKYQNFPPLASKEDIAAMKVIAISDRGTKRDFIDIYFLLKEFSLEEIFNFIKKKYPNFNIYVGLRGLTYFVDAGKKQKRRLHLTHFVSWGKIKKFLIGEVKKYKKECLK
ncbi:MAG: hypothetical protein COV62_00045 [Candidatus Nealsonbacteria bacterium CG11_big_fil_rev_8_21_14_0_20_35_11]|uniref:Nucleotidyl transferase AbiEii/AbiGii toxin family protein n=1 Tax=Candidatus Nealsonbacteria bacterium CG11_big_fil_rev_8_21_14_0_20_35_11 TaxID=1974713 RepID=A0A2H0N1U3_9BACT|nr:MAG: hypothetical protein COV62_00045 [Candidatus Nealsonbacteria bacterium CG11_big_fil_rev_8_21_14_0_20_35_11]